MAIYMKFGVVKGNVTAKDYEDWIELQSLQWGLGRGISTPVGAAKNREASSPSVSEVVVTKPMDKATTDLMKAALSDNKGVEAEIVITSTEQEKCRYKLTNTLVSGYSVSSGGDEPNESISLNFTKVEFVHSEFNLDNDAANPIRVNYDLALAKMG